MFIPVEIFVVLVVMLLGAWFLLGENKSFMEKCSIIIALLFLYVAFRIMNGATIEEIINPFIMK